MLSTDPDPHGQVRCLLQALGRWRCLCRAEETGTVRGRNSTPKVEDVVTPQPLRTALPLSQSPRGGGRCVLRGLEGPSFHTSAPAPLNSSRVHLSDLWQLPNLR